MELRSSSVLYAWSGLPGRDFEVRYFTLVCLAAIFVGLPLALFKFPLGSAFLQAFLAAIIGTAALASAALAWERSRWESVGEALLGSSSSSSSRGSSESDDEEGTRLIYNSELQPRLERSRLVVLSAAGAAAVSAVLLVALEATPGAQQRRADEAAELTAAAEAEAAKEARAKQRKSNQPDYCGSRYYKAIAGGTCDWGI